MPSHVSSTSLTYSVPDIAAASDDELDALFPRWDGVWSAQTRELVKRFGAAGIDLNDNWASTHPGWICPCCQRRKADLVRMTPARILMCHLEWHHDHLRDRGKAILRERNPPSDGSDRVGHFRAIDLCKGLIERFYPVLICQDCNAAEGQAKGLLRGVVDRDFSYSPVEITRFITSAPNVPHVVDAQKAEAAWSEVRPEFDDLVAFAHVLADRIADGRHRKVGAPPHLATAPTSAAILFDVASAASEGPPPYHLVGQLSARSIRRQGAMSTGRRPRRVVAPTDDEFAAFEAKQDSTTLWRRAPMDWRCATCSRDRRQIIRRSNNGAWTGQLHWFNEYQPETDIMSLWHREVDDPDAVVFGAHEPVIICGDCRHIITDVKTRESELTESSWSRADLQALVAGAAPNARHDIELDVAIAVARANAAREAAVADYYKHRSLALSVRTDVDLVQRRDRCSVDQALYTLAWDPNHSDEDNRAWEDRLRWLRGESDRFVALDRGGR